MPRTNTDEVYRNGVVISSSTRTVSDAEILAEGAPARLRASYAALRQWKTDADAVVAGWDGATTNTKLANTKILYDRFGKLCDGLADLLLYLSVDK